MSVHQQDELMQQLACSSCAFPIAFGPVTRSSKGYQCGRCPQENTEQNLIYEALAVASKYLFPCKYKNSGCEVLLPFGESMKDHEKSCPKILYKCQLAPEQKCDWKGTFSAIEGHFKATHSAIILEDLKMEVNLGGTTEIRFAYFYRSIIFFLIDVNFDKEQGLTVELMRVLKHAKVEAPVNEDYTMVLYNKDDKLSSSRNVGKYFLDNNSVKLANNNVINTALLNYITTTTIDKKSIVNIELQLPPSSFISNEVSAQALFACKNRMYGCNWLDSFNKIQQHESTCYAFGCPLGKRVCDWRGTRASVRNHCQDAHYFNTCVSPVVKLSEILSSGESTFFYVTATTNSNGSALYFRVCIKLEDVQTTQSSICIAVQYIGNAFKANEHKCFVQFEESDGKSEATMQLMCSPLTADEVAFRNSRRISLRHLEKSTLTFSFQ